MAFDPTKFGATPVSSNSAFDPSKFGATTASNAEAGTPTTVGKSTDYGYINNGGFLGSIANFGIGAVNTAKNIGVGVGSAIGSAGLGLGQVFAKGVSEIGKVTDIGSGGHAGEEFGNQLNDALEKIKKGIYEDPFKQDLSTGAGQVGTAIGTAAVFAEPGAAASKGEKVLDLLTGNMGTWTGALTRIAGKGALQGATAGITDFLRTGGDLSSAEKTALTAGMARAAFAVGGETARANNIPERLYSWLFKNDKGDMISSLKADSLASYAKSNPEEYQKLIDQGIVQVKDGAPAINRTLAQEALDRGLSGTLKSMAKQVVIGTYQNEQQAQELTSKFEGTIGLKEPQWQRVLNNIAEDYQDVGVGGKISSQASQLSQKIAEGGGEVDGTTALQIRRFFDRMRLASSFDKPATRLSLTQANLKDLADTLRGRLAETIPGFKAVMGDYTFNLDALDALAGEAKKRGSHAVLDIIDSMLLGGSLATGEVGPATLDVARRAAQLPSAITGIAQGLHNPALGPGASTLLQAGAATVPGGSSQRTQ